jgi:hypothetical protein
MDSGATVMVLFELILSARMCFLEKKQQNDHFCVEKKKQGRDQGIK